MKRIYLIILIATLTLSCMAQTIGEAFYIYRNDGQFNAFFRDEVLSIDYSCEDADGNCYDEIVTQIVNTVDSVYKIPLAAIDSVGFVQPEMKFQSDVMRMDASWLPYVVGITDNSISFLLSTPIDFLPQQGQVLVAETFDPPFETGFSGRVTSIDTYPDRIVFEVEDVLLSDIYQRLVTVGISSSEGAEENATGNSRRIWGMNTNNGRRFPLMPIVDLTVGPVSISCTPTITMKYIVCLWEHNLKNYIDICCYQTYDGSVTINANLNKDFTPEPKWAGPGITVPTPVPGLYGRVQVGGFFRSTGSVQLSATKRFYREGVSGFVYSEDSGFKRINEWKNLPEEDWEASVSIDGSLSAGVAGRLQFGLAHEKLASADITLYVGPEISGHAELKATELAVDKNLYSAIKDSEITLSIISDVVPGYQLAGFKSSDVMPDPPTHQDTPVSLKFTWPLNHWFLVPEFDNLKWKAETSGGDLSGNISRNLLPKVALGWGLYDEDDNLYKREYFNEKYRKLEDWPHHGLAYHLDNMKKNTTYKAYPLVNLLGVEMRADKSVDVLVKDCPVTLSDFRVTNRQYKENGFMHDGMSYDYCFNVSVNATLADNAEDISDWGYVYLAPNGQEAFISLHQFGTTYTDTRWAYYRNGAPPFTCKLYGYVQYMGSDELVYGEPHDYPLEYGESICPDGNHPHWIDLGLPSGTKWACCNVGANTPEGYGNYYAWGETQPKNLYNWHSYQHWHNSNGDHVIDPNEITNIGTDIAGTIYDAATINWGVPWRMPSLGQIQELFNNTTSISMILNGVSGYKFVSSHGSFIFLPIDVTRWTDEQGYGGTIGCYWSSTSSENDPTSPYHWDWSNYLPGRSTGIVKCCCIYGHFIRPVR